MNYITFKKMFDYVDRIEKARSHKYIDRRPKKTGKGWYYIYAETFKKPFRALLEIFDIKKERIDKDYEADNIQKDFGVDKNLYASHVLEFFLNREKWHNIFSKKENRQKYTQAVKQSDVEKKAKEKKEKSTEKKKTTTETTKTQKLNRSLMFRVWRRNTPEAEKLLEENKERFVLNKITGVDKLTEEDFTSPKRSVLLAPMANNFYEQTGVEKKEILIKQNIFEKNKNHHPEIKTVEENRKIIENALYGNNIAMLCKPNEKPNYWTAVKADDYYCLAVIDTDPSKEYHEVVGWRRISDKGFENMKKQVEKEGGQFLIMGGNTVDHSADLSDVQSNHNENIPESNPNVNGEHGNKEAMLGNDNAKKYKGGKKTEALIDFVRRQTTNSRNGSYLDLNKYIRDEWSKRGYLNVRMQDMTRNEQVELQRLAIKHPDVFTIEDNGGLGMALVYGNKLHEQDKERTTDEGNSVEQIKNALKEDFKNKAIEKPQIEYSRENYDKLFPRGNIKTPIGHVKLGENQYEKLKAKSREDLLGVVAETLKNPLVIINENGSHIYAKSFVESGKTKSYQSVVIKIDGKDISISTHQRDTNNILNKIKKAEDVIYTNDSQQLPSSRNALVVGTTRETDSSQLPGTWNKPEMAGTTRETKLPHFDSQNVNPNEVSDNSEEMSSTEHGNKEAMKGNDNAKKDLTDGELAVRLNLAYLNGILEKNHIQTIENPQIGEISVEAGKTGKHGYGLKHIIEQRFKKDGKNENEIAALIMLVADAAGSGEIRNNNGNRIEIVKNGIMAIVSKERNGKKENWLLTGYDLFDEKEKATDAINEVISRYGYTPGFSGLKTQVGAVIASLEDYTSKETNVNGEHGNKTAMLGNQNAFKGHLANKETVKFVNTVKGEPYEEWNTDVNKFAVYYNRETGKETGLVMTQDIADIIDSCDEPSVLDWKERIANDIHAKYPKIDKRYIEEAITAIRMGYRNGKKQNIKIIEEQSVNVKPQSDSEMKKEQEKTKKARKEAGLPDINENKLNARVSAIEDLSWNPNDENYRYKDTGYIAGARKEMALFVLKNAGKNKVRLRETDIDWEGVEENHRAAKEVIVKSNIFGQVDWAALKENGMTGGAAFLIDRIYSYIGKEPTKDTPEARKNYVIAVNGLRDRLETAKTVQDVENALNEIKDEMNGQFFSVKDTPEYKEKLAEISEIRSKVKGIKDEANRLYDVYNRQDQRENEIIGESKLKWLREHKIIRHNQKYLYGVENKMTPELKAEYDSYCEKLNIENKKESRRLFDEWQQFRNENGAVIGKDSKHIFEDGAFTYINYEIERELLDKEKELKVYAAKEGAKVLLQNPLFKAWIELGDKFDVIVRSSWKNKTFYNHKADARRGIYDDWEWANKEKIEVSRKGKERKAQFEFKVASKYERKGGRNVSVESTEQLKKAFNLRDIQSGNWVLKDPESAKWHVDRIAEGFADLADVTGIPDNLISLNGRLAMAIGARGVGGAGAAKALYEPTERVINITKMKGGGSLGHEWFHALDNMIMEAMGGNEGTSAYMMTNKYAHLKPKDKELLNNYLNETYPFMKQRLKMELEKKGIEIPQEPKEIFQIKVANAFDNLTKVMTEGNTVIKEKIIYTHADYKQAVFNIKANAATTTGRKLFEAGNIDNAMNILNGIYKDRKSKTSTKWYKLAVAFYCGNANVEKELVRIDMGKRGSSFLEEALVLDNGTNEYWSSTHEMAARAFSAYIDDKLRSQDRYNDYLANYTENKYYRDPILGDVFPYPEGEERKKINQAFDDLFEVIRSENAIRKAMLFEESAHPRGNGGRFTKKFAPDKGANFGGSSETSHINTKFNAELEEYKKGNLPPNHIFKLGKPNEILVKVGFPANDDIELRANQLQIKLDKHNFTVDNIKDLPEMLQKPVAVFKYGDEKKAQNIIVELQKDGKNFLVGVHFKNQGEDVSSIRGLFNRDNHEWLNWITKGKALYVNTKKLQNLINQQRINLADVEYLDLESIESLLKKNSGVKDLFLTQEMNVEIRKSRFINRLNHEFCKLVEQEERKKAYLKKLGEGYIEYLKKHYPELV